MQRAETVMTMMIVSHEMGFAREISDRLLMFDEGPVLEEGTSEEMFTNPQQHTPKFSRTVLRP
jgi:ABC-type polar amino acid transport system ATPase subunit